MPCDPGALTVHGSPRSLHACQAPGVVGAPSRRSAAVSIPSAVRASAASRIAAALRGAPACVEVRFRFADPLRPTVRAAQRVECSEKLGHPVGVRVASLLPTVGTVTGDGRFDAGVRNARRLHGIDHAEGQAIAVTRRSLRAAKLLAAVRRPGPRWCGHCRAARLSVQRSGLL